MDLKSAEVQLGIAAVALAGIVFATQGDIHTTDSWFALLNDKVSFDWWPFGSLITTLHVINSVQNNNRGHWCAAFGGAYLSAFAGVILPALLKGESYASTFANEESMTLAFVCWYLTNHKVPFVNFDLWGTITGFGGDALAHVLDIASLVFTTNLVIAEATAANSAATAGFFGFACFGPVIMASAAACANDFLPPSKGVKITVSEAGERAFLAAWFISTNGFAAIPHVGVYLAKAIALVNVCNLDNAQIIMVTALVQWLATHQTYVPWDPLVPVYSAFHKATGLSSA
jgi:hypothetical protein